MKNTCTPAHASFSPISQTCDSGATAKVRQMQVKSPVNVHIQPQNEGERHLSDFDHSGVVGTRRAGLRISNMFMHNIQ